MDFDFLRVVVPLVLAVAAAAFVDRATARRGLQPPGFVTPLGEPSIVPALRRVVALTALAFVFFLGVFAPLGVIGLEQTLPAQIETPQLFQLHFFFATALLIWFLAGYGGAGGSGESLVAIWRRQFGLRRSGVGRELAIGAGVGLAAWLCVLTTLMLIGALIYLLGGEDLLPKSPPPVVSLVAALPLVVRMAISLSAGVVEELFFRGFLQPRVGIGLSTGAFVLAHLSYEQPLMLVGITMLSLVFAGLVRWRQSIWAAIAAHTVFDGVQLLLVIPQLLELLEPGASGPGPIG